MRLDPSQTQSNTGADSVGSSLQLPRGSLVYAQPAPAFTRAMNLAQKMQPGGVWVPAQSNPSPSGASTYSRFPSPTTSSPTAQAGWAVTVKSGQTLSGIVRDQMASRGVFVSNSDALKLSQVIAKNNGITNVNLIHPGQQLNLDGLNLALNQGIANKQAVTAAEQLARRQITQAGVQGQKTDNSSTKLQPNVTVGSDEHPVLDKTLDRAVEKGFIPEADKQAVRNKVLDLAVQYRFAPDDFARLTLMESDGMNPKATNTHCHGIIQFCAGPDRGAASVGFSANPKEILGHSVLKQLDMVDKFFSDTGLHGYGPVTLDDLYLTVLTPAARSETRPNVALNIPGTQAAYLHVNRDVAAPITRDSIIAGLHQNANERLRGQASNDKQRTLTSSVPTSRINAYVAQAVDGATKE